MKDVIEALAVVITGPIVGVEFAVAAFTNPVLARLPDEAFRAGRSDAARVLGKVMPFWYVATLVALAVAAGVAGGDLSGWLRAVAAALMAAIVLLTVTMMVPINNRIGAWSANGEFSRALAARWDRLHWLRVAILALLFVLPTIACFG
jgi:hypothetical protein